MFTPDAQSQESRLPPMFRPPVNRAMRVLDRPFFRKSVALSAAGVFKDSDISRCRAELIKSRDLVQVPNLSTIQDLSDPGSGINKCLLLREGVKHDGGWLLAWLSGFADEIR